MKTIRRQFGVSLEAIRKIVWLIFGAFFLCAFSACGTLGPADAPAAASFAPGVGFDAASARNALAPTGTGVIKGTACVGIRNPSGGIRGRQFAVNQGVLLFPVTPYLEDWVKRMRSAEPGSQVATDPRFMVAKLVGRTNDMGDFEFSHLKAGNYYLMTTLGSSISGSRNEYAGTAQSGDITIDYYDKRNFTNAYSDFLEKTVTLKEGETTTISLSIGHPPLLFFLGASNGWPGPYGCRHFSGFMGKSDVY